MVVVIGSLQTLLSKRQVNVHQKPHINLSTHALSSLEFALSILQNSHQGIRRTGRRGGWRKKKKCTLINHYNHPVCALNFHYITFSLHEDEAFINVMLYQAVLE